MDVVQAALKAHASDAGRISFDGPDVVLSADVALPLSLAIHELATNAIKYGSLGVDQGTVVITWTVKNGRIDLQWMEADGPPVTAPTRKGFGSVLIERAFPATAAPRSVFEYRPDGLHFEINFGYEEP